jgi:hypothetical protein
MNKFLSYKDNSGPSEMRTFIKTWKRDKDEPRGDQSPFLLGSQK